MPIIDGHIHLWSHDMTRYPDIAWRDDGNSHLPQETVAPRGWWS